MNPSNKKMMELCTVISIPQFTKCKVSNGRLKGLYDKLENVITKELEALPKMTTLNRIRVDALLEEFFKSTGWQGKPRHIATLASFCLEMLENSEFKYNQRITDVLNDIVDYFDRAGKAPAITYWAGGVAARKWSDIMEVTSCA